MIQRVRPKRGRSSGKRAGKAERHDMRTSGVAKCAGESGRVVQMAEPRKMNAPAKRRFDSCPFHRTIKTEKI